MSRIFGVDDSRLQEQVHYVSRHGIQYEMDGRLTKGPEVSETAYDAPFNSTTALHQKENHGSPSDQFPRYAEHTSPFSTNKISRWSKFFGLIITTAVSVALYLLNLHNTPLPLSFQTYLTANTSSVKSWVTVLSIMLGYLEASAISGLINQASRLHLANKNTSLNRLWLWSNVCSGSFTWHLPWRMWLVLIIYLAFCLSPSATWAPAISPVALRVVREGVVGIPSYSNITLIHEYPSEKDSPLAPSVLRNTKGIFSYGVATALQGSILSAAGSATPIDNSTQTASKLDNTGFQYMGRSYGVGAGVGLVDSILLNTTFAQDYAFVEDGYDTQVLCYYNMSSTFALKQVFEDLYQTTGELPDSNVIQQNATYFGKGGTPIVALGVSSSPPASSMQRIVSIAAGSDYAALNSTQCTITFIPTAFTVVVNITARSISVSPLPSAELAAPNIESSGTLLTTATRQLAIISEDQTNFYQSLVGNSFLSSISSYNISQNLSSSLTQANSTLTGLENSLTSMIDDILGAYAAAQIMISGATQETAAVLMVEGMALGSLPDSLLALIWNGTVVLIMLIEAIRTRGWRNLHGWDYSDLRSVIVSTSRGGQKIADRVAGLEEGIVVKTGGWRGWGLVRAFSGSKTKFQSQAGMVMVGLERESGALVLAEEREVRKRSWGWRSRGMSAGRDGLLVQGGRRPSWMFGKGG